MSDDIQQTLLVDGPKKCRICLEEDGVDLFAPCACSGSIKWVHRECMHEWLTTSPNREDMRRCNQCQTEYTVGQGISRVWSGVLACCSGIVHAPFVFIGVIQLLYILTLMNESEEEMKTITAPIGVATGGIFAAIGTGVVVAVSCKTRENQITSEFMSLLAFNTILGGLLIGSEIYTWFPTLGTCIMWGGAKIAVQNAAHILAEGLQLEEYSPTEQVV